MNKKYLIKKQVKNNKSTKNYLILIFLSYFQVSLQNKFLNCNFKFLMIRDVSKNIN